MVNTRTQTYNNAKRFSILRRHKPYGMCLQWSREMAGIPVKYPDAITCARHAKLSKGTPPKGTFVYWKNNSGRGHGHIAISAGDGYVYSTDFKVSRRVDKVKISAISVGWKMTYLGWSDECNDRVLKPEVTNKPSPPPVIAPPSPVVQTYPWPSTQIVYTSLVRPGQKNSDSVWWIQRALNFVPLIGGKEVPLTAAYDEVTIARAKLFQWQKCGDTPDGDLGPKQIRYLFKLAGLTILQKEKP